MSRRITVLVGTDHHPFERLVSWADAHQRRFPEDRVTIQHGASRAPEMASGVELMSLDELVDAVGQSDIVVTHGGPGTIMDSRRAGHRPLVLARNPAFHEHVDNHQMLFAAWADNKGLATLVPGISELDEAVAAMTPAGTRHDGSDTSTTDQTAARFETLLAGLSSSSRVVATNASVVLYLGAASRSGATVLESVLSELPGVVVLGDVTRLWDRGLISDDACSCGLPMSKCDFWQEVGLRAFGGWDRVPVERVLSLRKLDERQHPLPGSLRRAPGAARRAVLIEYSEYFRRIYDAARRVSGAEVVVDSSKGAPTALALSHNRHIDLRVLHLTRDARAVASGWPEITREAGLTGPRLLSTRQAARDWLSQNVALRRGLRHRGIPRAQMRFEDLIRDPAGTVSGAWESLRLPTTDWSAGAAPLGQTLTLHQRHSIAGSPFRFATGPVTLHPEAAWHVELSPVDRQLVTAVSWPLMRAFGYRAEPEFEALERSA